MKYKEFTYNNGTPSLPPDGRYNVIMEIQGGQTVLEKTILNGEGSNHLPILGLRYFKIPFMNFSVKLRNSEVCFIYDNNVLVDVLSKISHTTWLGKILYKGKFIDWFWLKQQ